MAQFSNFYLTNAGAVLLSKVQAGGQLQFNRMALGDGTWAGGTFNPAMTGLVSPQVTFGVQTVSSIGGGLCRIASLLLHSNLVAAGFNGRELGLFAQDPDLGEILYAVAYAGDLSDYIPAQNAVPAYQQVFNLTVAIGNATSLTVEISAQIVVATLQDLEAHALLTAAHGATVAVNADRIALRNAQGQTSVAPGTDPSHAVALSQLAEEIANRAEALEAHASAYNQHGASSAAIAGRMILRDSGGRGKIAAPAAGDDIARLDTVTAHANLIAPHGAASSPTAGRLALRLSDGRLRAAAGISGNDVVIMGQYSRSLSGNGYRICPDGMIEQWGSISVPANGSATLTFATAFPNAFRGFSLASLNAYGAGLIETTQNVLSADRFGITIFNRATGDGSGTARAVTVLVRAIGY